MSNLRPTRRCAPHRLICVRRSRAYRNLGYGRRRRARQVADSETTLSSQHRKPQVTNGRSRSILAILSFILAIALFTPFTVYLREFIAVESGLDSGGSFNYE